MKNIFTKLDTIACELDQIFELLACFLEFIEGESDVGDPLKANNIKTWSFITRIPRYEAILTSAMDLLKLRQKELEEIVAYNVVLLQKNIIQPNE